MASGAAVAAKFEALAFKISFWEAHRRRVFCVTVLQPCCLSKRTEASRYKRKQKWLISRVFIAGRQLILRVTPYLAGLSFSLSLSACAYVDVTCIMRFIRTHIILNRRDGIALYGKYLPVVVVSCIIRNTQLYKLKRTRLFGCYVHYNRK